MPRQPRSLTPGAALAALLLGTAADAQYFDQPANPTMADCDELWSQYQRLANETFSDGHKECLESWPAVAGGAFDACMDEVTQRTQEVRDQGHEAAEACRVEARDHAAAARTVARRVHEVYERYQQVKEIAENPVRFFEYALPEERVHRLIHDFGFGRVLTSEGQYVYDHVVHAAKWGSSGFVNPLISSYNEEVLDELERIFRGLIEEIADLEAEIAEMEDAQ